MQFVDHAKIVIESGAGGDGLVAWRREKFVAYGGPAGGDGGHGGSIYFEATTNLHTLLDFQYQHTFKAQDGEKGGNKNCYGKAGKDLTIKVPCGTVLFDAETGDAIADLTNDGDKVMVAAGGRGGRGNNRFSTPKRQAPQFAEPGEPAIRRELIMELKLMADVGLVGMPNAGKSTLISVISAAKPKIANYPFTTLTPNLGVVRNPAGGGIVVADIPGLIEGASEGIGLGHEFLRHVERTRLLLHLVDISIPEEQEPLATYRMINSELAKYSEKLAKKPQMIVLTKSDAVYEPDEIERLKKAFETESGAPVFVISAVAQQGLDPLLHAVFEKLESLEPEVEVVQTVADLKAFNHDDSAFEITAEGASLIITGGKVERLMRVTDLRNGMAMRRTFNIFKAMGVFDALQEAGIVPGQTVIISGFEFEYDPDLA